ncbi:hypothetical protein ATANTOWER_001464, partial [Ataeniobius toweri]|nr:hypothetical protein [Ataeniobius toweri]
FVPVTSVRLDSLLQTEESGEFLLTFLRIFAFPSCSRYFLHLRGIPPEIGGCRCRSSDVEQGERFFTHLPAGAHSSLGKQIGECRPRTL